MVLSGSKKTSSIASITNKPSGGGSKKAGQPYQVGRSAWSTVGLRGTSQNETVLKTDAVANVKQSRPVGTRPMNFTYNL